MWLRKTHERQQGDWTKPVNLKGDKPRTFTGRTDAEAEAPVFSSSDANRLLIGKVSAAGKDWGQKEKRASEDERVDSITDAMNMNLGKLWEVVRDRESWSAAVYGVSKNQTWLGDWTTTTVSQYVWADHPVTLFIHWMTFVMFRLPSLETDLHQTFTCGFSCEPKFTFL